MEITPIAAVAHGDIVCTSLPIPVTSILLGLTTTSGIYPAILQMDGSLEIYYPIFTDIARADISFSYPIAE